MNIILFLGAFLGLVSMVMAAYIDHALGLTVSDKVLKGLLTAVRYHQIYSVMLCLIGLSLVWHVDSEIKKWLYRSAFLFFIGVMTFSFSIYLAAIFDLTWITHATPVGGFVLMLGWLALMRLAVLSVWRESF